MLGLLSKLLASLLVPLLFVATIGLTLNQTVLSSHYIEGQLQSQDAYTKLSDAITTELAKNATTVGVPDSALNDRLKTIVTPTVVQQRLTGTLDQVQAYYQKGGPAPSFDISDIVAQAEAAGLPAPTDTNLTKPIELTPVMTAKKAKDNLAGVRVASMAAIVLLALGMVAIAIRRHLYTPLANVVISLGVSVGVAGLAVLLLVGVIDRHIHFDYTTNVFAGVTHDLTTAMFHDIGRRLLITGAIVLVVGIVCRISLQRYLQASAPKLRSTKR